MSGAGREGAGRGRVAQQPAPGAAPAAGGGAPEAAPAGPSAADGGAPEAAPAGPSAAVLFAALRELGMTHLVGLPDNGTARLLALAAGDPGTVLLTVTREGEAFAVASGLWLGGAVPVVTVQNTGLLESGDSLRGTALRMGVPLLVLVSVRGHAKMVAHRAEIEDERATGRLAAATMKRADVDSVALVTAPQRTYAADADAGRVRGAWELAQAGGHPVALMLPAALE
jgi:sulfopyruvate decarboxylase TPP-binding subunit